MIYNHTEEDISANTQLFGILTQRELTIAKQVAIGHTTRQIAASIHRSPKTIETHIEHIKKKLGLRARYQIALVTFSALGLLKPFEIDY